MQLIYFCTAGLMCGLALARPARVRRGVDCAFSTSADSGATCESFSSSWGISAEDLQNLNPGLECPELDPYELYCVIGTVNDDPPATVPSTSSTTSTQAPTTKDTSPATTQPQPTRTSATHIRSSSVVHSASSTTSAGNGVATPQPTQPGIVANCNKFHYIAKGVSCSNVISYEKISLADFVEWNPSVGADCSGMWAGVNVCVGIIGGSTKVVPSTTTTPAKTTKAAKTTTVGNGIATPTPIQPDMVSNCAKFHWVAKGVTCSQIISYEKITLAEFSMWNPSVKADCSGMWAEVNVCVGVIGGSAHSTKPTTTIRPTTTTSAGNGIATPTPIQPGMVSNCKKFHYVSEGNTCGQIISYEKISLANFVEWNTGVGASCNNMWGRTYVCVGV